MTILNQIFYFSEIIEQRKENIIFKLKKLINLAFKL